MTTAKMTALVRGAENVKVKALVRASEGEL